MPSPLPIIDSLFSLPPAPATPAIGDPASPESHHLSPSPAIAATSTTTTTTTTTMTTASRSDSIHLSAPSTLVYQSPVRQHRRTPSYHYEVKETLDAVSEFADDQEDGWAHHKINQYTIKDPIGSGSFGSVHLAVDQYGREFAIKQFSKATLRKRKRSNIMRQGPARLLPGDRPGMSLSPAMRFASEAKAEAKDALYLIREEIAVMKKLNHFNLVQLIEVLDDPEEDSLYMVLEMCKKGVVMDVGLGKRATPYDLEACRCWFRDLILGIEYLHAQKILHRDIKPDNLLITGDDVLKIGDFGVSQVFEKMGAMRTSKTLGSPAFLPPELCTSHHGDVSGTACDIWSMGVTLYCLRYGNIPFEHSGIMELYESIRDDNPTLPEDEDADFLDLMHQILEKDPEKRITMPALRDHPWITQHGRDLLLSAKENCAEPIEPPNALEVNHAFTRNIGHLLCVIKAIRKFKGLLSKRQETQDVPRSLPTFGSEAGTTASDSEIARLVQEMRDNKRKASLQLQEIRNATTGTGTGTGVVSAVSSGNNIRSGGAGFSSSTRGPMPLLGIGVGGVDDFQGQPEVDGIVSESPTAADFDVHDMALQAEEHRIRSQHDRTAVFPDSMLVLGLVPDAAGGLASELGPGSARNTALADVVSRAMEESKSST